MNPRTIASIGAHPIHVMLVPFPIVCFVGAFVTDIVYWRSMSFIWETFSVWLLTAGLVMAGFAMIAGLIDFAANRRIRDSDQPGFMRWAMGSLLHWRSSTFSSTAATAIPPSSRRASFSRASSFLS
jgi:uncharacterized membrane protein